MSYPGLRVNVIPKVPFQIESNWLFLMENTLPNRSVANSVHRPNQRVQYFENKLIRRASTTPSLSAKAHPCTRSFAAGFLFGADGRACSHRMRRTKNEGALWPPKVQEWNFKPPSRGRRSCGSGGGNPSLSA